MMIGQTYGGYRILKKIGQGGMGEVYLADDTSLQRRVALKFLSPEMQQDASAHRRLLREAKSAAALDHPYICHINHVGEAEGKDFIVMEYVEGETLQEKLAHGPLSLSQTKQIAAEVLEALEEAHEKGIVHRDLKPANIMLTSKGHAKVMDFGLAKQLPPIGQVDSQAETIQEIDQSGAIVGTLAYMSPEQLRGKPADSRSDLFSFGIVFYEMLTSSHPFRRPSPMETISAILTEPPASLDQHKRKIPGQFKEILEKLLTKNSLERYQSAREVHAALDVTFRDERVGLIRRRFLRPIWLAIILIVLVLGVVPISWWVRDNYFLSPRVALAFEERDWILIADFENLTGDPVFDRSLQTAMTVGIQQSQYVNVLPPNRIQESLQRMRKESGVKLDEALACELAIREGVKAVVVCSISEVGGVYSLTVRLVEPNKQTAVLSETATAAEKNQVLLTLDFLVRLIRQNLGESLQSISHQGLALPKATTESLEALQTFADGRKQLGTDNDEAGIELIKHAVEIDPDFALAHAELGMDCYMNGARVKGEEHFAKATSLLDRLTLRERLWINAVVEDWRGNRTQAVEFYKAYLAQYPDDNGAWFRLGWVYMAGLSQYDKGVEAFQRALEIDSSDTGSYINIATCYSGLGQDEKAIEHYEKAFELRPSYITGNYINEEYGFTLARSGNIQKAGDVFQKMIVSDEIWKKARGYRSLGILSMYQGKLSDAIKAFRQAILLNSNENLVISEYRDHMFLASAYRLKGQNADFASELVLAERMLSDADFSPFWVSILAKIYARTGKTREASHLLNSMISQAENPAALSAINRTDQGDQADIALLKGEIALAGGNAVEAIDSFELSLQLEPRSLRPLESVAFAYQSLGKWQESVDKYEEIIAKVVTGREEQEYWILAHYELGKIYMEQGNTQKAKEYFGKFIDIWKDGDPDIPILKEAKAEYAKLQ